MRSTSKKTVRAYVSAAADKLHRGISAAARCDDVTNAELARLRDQLRATYQLERLLSRRPRRAKQ